MTTIVITETHPDVNYSMPISNLYKDYGNNPNINVKHELDP